MNHNLLKYSPKSLIWCPCCSMYQWLLFITEYYSIMNILHFVYSFSSWWIIRIVSSFWLLWIMLLWTFMTSLCVGIYFHISWVKNLGVELLGYMVTLCLTVQGSVALFSSVAAPFYAPSAIHKGSNFSVSLPALVSVIIVVMKWYLIVVLICISLMTNDVQWCSCAY